MVYGSTVYQGRHQITSVLAAPFTSYLNSRFGRGSADWGAVTFAEALWLVFGALTPITYVLARRYPLRREAIVKIPAARLLVLEDQPQRADDAIVVFVEKLSPRVEAVRKETTGNNCEKIAMKGAQLMGFTVLVDAIGNRQR